MVDGCQQKVDDPKLGFLVDPRNGGRLAESQAIDRNEESGGGACCTDQLADFARPQPVNPSSCLLLYFCTRLS